MKDVKVIKLTIKQLLITQVTIVAILTTCTQLKNVKEMRISEKVLNEENKLEIARAVNIETKLKTSGKQTQLLSKREGADSQVMTRSALTERQKNNENSKIAQQKEETIQEGEQETILQNCEIINQIGVPLTNFQLVLNCTVKVILYSLIVFMQNIIIKKLFFNFLFIFFPLLYIM